MTSLSNHLRFATAPVLFRAGVTIFLILAGVGLAPPQDAIAQDDKVLIVDDLIATGGTAWATGELIRKLGGEVLGAAFVIELSFLDGRARLAPMETFSLVTY